MSQKLNVGLTGYLEKHPLHAKNILENNGDIGQHPFRPAGIPGGDLQRHGGRRGSKQVHEDILAGHEFMNTDVHHLSTLPTHLQNRSHAEAESVGYALNKHKYDPKDS